MKCIKQSIYILIATILLGGCILDDALNSTNEPNYTTEASVHEPDKAAQLNLELGMAYMERNDNERALGKLQKAIKIDPRFADAHNAIGILYARLGEDAKAGNHFEKAVQLAPNDSGALNNYGQHLCAHSQREEADKMFVRAVKNPLYQTPEYAYLNAGICAKEDQDIEQAEIHFRAALKKNPYMPPALYQMADLSHSLGRQEPAKKYIERYAESTGRHSARSLWLAIRIERALGDVDAEASYALLLKHKFPDSEETRLLLKTEDK